MTGYAVKVKRLRHGYHDAECSRGRWRRPSARANGTSRNRPERTRRVRALTLVQVANRQVHQPLFRPLHDLV